MLLAGLVAAWAGEAEAATLLQPDDPILAIDVDPPQSTSEYPGPEGPANVLDETAATKYLNFGEENSGFIVTPQAGPTILRSFMLTTAFDAPVRDPAAWELWGTNDPINSTDNSLGDGEAWTAISSGSVALPDDRLTDGPLLPVTNATSYTSYRLVFTALENAALANSMQVADVRFFESSDGSGDSFLAAGDDILAIDLDETIESAYPGAEAPANAIDGDPGSKYLNFGAEGSGFIVTPSVGASVVTSFTITTANDAEQRDPTSWELYGTDDAISSLDNSQGTGEAWTLIDAGSVALPSSRLSAGPEVFPSNPTPYRSYRMVFPTLKGGSGAAAMQLGEIQFDGCTCFFADGFESGDTSAWSHVQPALLLETTELEQPGDAYWGAFEVDRAALRRVSRHTGPLRSSMRQAEGMQQPAFPVLARFAGGGRLIVGSGRAGGGRTGELFAVEVRRLGGTPELRLRARLDDGSWTDSPWTPLPRHARWLELRWRRALPEVRDGELALHVDGDLRAALRDLANAGAPLTAIAIAKNRERAALVHERSNSVEEAR